MRRFLGRFGWLPYQQPVVKMRGSFGSTPHRIGIAAGVLKVRYRAFGQGAGRSDKSEGPGGIGGLQLSE